MKCLFSLAIGQIFWITIIRNALLEDERAAREKTATAVASLRSFEEFCQHHTELTDSRLFQKYYTREVLFTDSAKTVWTAPNLEPLPLDPIVSALPDSFAEVKSAPDAPRPAPLRNYSPSDFEFDALKFSVASENCAT